MTEIQKIEKLIGKLERQFEKANGQIIVKRRIMKKASTLTRKLEALKKG